MSDVRWRRRGAVRRLQDLLVNPFFRNELERPGRRAWLASLVLANVLYVALFWTARAARDTPSGPGDLEQMSAQFDYAPWLLAGAVLLSFCAHWLVPPFVRIDNHRYGLRTLRLMVQGRHTEEEALRGTVAGAVAPLAAGAAPLLVGLPLLALYAPGRAGWAAAALLAAALWGALSTCVSVWSGIRHRAPRTAALCAYLLTSLALPLVIGAITLGLAWGCSAGHPRRESVFCASAALTWGILVVGSTAAFWDVAFGALFPEKRQCLWQEQPAPIRLEP
jgi:hypothetical protein